jgi:hypothetical protein
MKKTKFSFGILTAILVFLSSITLSYSQTKFGATLGLNISRFTNGFKTVNGSYLNFSSKGLSIGAFAEFEISKKIKFYPKIIYNQIGDREKDYDNYFAIDKVDYKLDYISIPLNFKFFNKPYLAIGPQFGFLLSEKGESLNFGDVKTSIDIGGNFGIGYPINDFRIELNFYQGFSTLLEIEEEFNNNIIDVRNTYLNLSIGYNIK